MLDSYALQLAYHFKNSVYNSDETVWDFEFGSVSVFLCPKNLAIGIEIGMKSVSESVSVRIRYRYEIGMKSVSESV